MIKATPRRAHKRKCLRQPCFCENMIRRSSGNHEVLGPIASRRRVWLRAPLERKFAQETVG
jgi:hypothetical protein